MVYNPFEMDKLFAALEKVVTTRTGEERRLYALDGVEPEVVVLPRSREEIGATLRLCSEQGAPGLVWGGGTQVEVGNPMPRYLWAIDMRALSEGLEYSAADLVVTVDAGMTLQRLQDVLHPHRQWFPNDAPLPSRQTIGGIVSSGGAGSGRLRYGLPREWVLAVEAVAASGEVFRAGVGVVKNVAGYDIPRLLSGSWGTLAVLTRVTLKLAPEPEVRRVYKAPLEGASAFALLDEQLNYPLFQPEMLDIVHEPERGWYLVVGMAGFEEDVRWQYDLLCNRTRREYEAVSTEEQARLRDWHLTAPSIVRCRAGVPPGETYRLLSWLANLGEGLAVHAQAGSGVVRVWWESEPCEDTVVSALRQEARRLGGFCVLERAPVQMKRRLGVWGNISGGFAVMQRLKQLFDPAGVLAPGRFVEGG